MNVVKLVGIGLITLILSLIIKEYKKEYSIYVSLIGGLIIIFESLGIIQEIISFINKISGGTSYNKELIRFIIKDNWNFHFSSICCYNLPR